MISNLRKSTIEVTRGQTEKHTSLIYLDKWCLNYHYH